MENKNWIEKLLLFIPKSKFNVVKLWDEEYKCNIIDIYNDKPYLEVEYYLSYDVKKSTYSIGFHIYDNHSEEGWFYEDINSIGTACAALIFYIWRKECGERKRKQDEEFEAWRNRIKQLANNLFVEVSKYFDVKESDKSLVYKYGWVNDAERIPEKQTMKKSCLITCKKIEVLQTAEK
ncbi:MAG: hypothetical protein IKW77_08170 [Salinivirgaceae bacterium]|nr:hypothetical protein [Salinivirgaceae bacterium]